MKARSKSTGSRDHGITPRESISSVTHRAGRLLIFLWLRCWSEISLSSCFLSTSNVQHTETESHKYFYTHSEKHSRAGTHIPEEQNIQLLILQSILVEMPLLWSHTLFLLFLRPNASCPEIFANTCTSEKFKHV